MIKYDPKARIGKNRGALKPPSNFSLSAEHHVTVTLDDKTKELLERLNSNIQLIAERLDNSQSDIIPEAFIELAAEQKAKEDIDEPAELSGVNPVALGESEKYGHIVYANELQDELNHVVEFPALKWKEEENGTLTLDYHGSIVEKITWAQIEKLTSIEKKARMPHIRGIKGVGSSNNKKTAISVFCQCVERGIINPPSHNPDIELENNFSQFVREEDPDAAFKPMLTAYSTRPDVNCGKVEGSLEAV